LPPPNAPARFQARAALPEALLAAAEASFAAGGAEAAAAALAAAGLSPADVDRGLTQREQKRLLLPLLRLRQACCHPQVGAGGIKTLSASAKPMTMGEILEARGLRPLLLCCFLRCRMLPHLVAR